MLFNSRKPWKICENLLCSPLQKIIQQKWKKKMKMGMNRKKKLSMLKHRIIIIFIRMCSNSGRESWALEPHGYIIFRENDIINAIKKFNMIILPCTSFWIQPTTNQHYNNIASRTKLNVVKNKIHKNKNEMREKSVEWVYLWKFW
jgi:hypothetical protein